MADKLPTEDIKEAVDNKLKARVSRRGFLTRAIVAGAAVTVTAGAAKKVASKAIDKDLEKKALANDVEPGDRDLAMSKCTLMSRADKEEFLSMLSESRKG